jgi:hypothetical protein
MTPTQIDLVEEFIEVHHSLRLREAVEDDNTRAIVTAILLLTKPINEIEDMLDTLDTTLINNNS